MADGGGGWRPPRPCEAYRAEWELCRSARHLLHHYYVHGERPACEQWRRDLASCRAWEQRRSNEAQPLKNAFSNSKGTIKGKRTQTGAKSTQAY
ncbi:synaptic plasticity regulator PANTS isoform X2 [Microcebus murinus]|uniref:synaptic plasticity regulator PANTS isoform X2 n=1 Tax=Microcebus murinus TaxID=30608 RepID=UPI003F6C936A